MHVRTRIQYGVMEGWDFAYGVEIYGVKTSFFFQTVHAGLSFCIVDHEVAFSFV